MKLISHCFKGILFLFSFLIFSISTAQVGIGTVTPNPDALLDIDATTTTGGLLLSRVTLTVTTSFAPLSAHVQGMVVYNTATVNDVTPGFYYNTGATWVRLGAGGASNDWSMTGNATTAPGTNYLGSSDGIDVVLATAGSENMRLVNGGQVSVNNAAPLAVDRFTVTGAAGDDAINGYSSGTNISVYGENTAGGYGVLGSSNTGTGTTGVSNAVGVLGETVSNGYGVYGYADNAGAIAGRMRNLDATGISMLVTGQARPLLAYTGGAATFSGTIGLFSIGTADGLLAAGSSLVPVSIPANPSGISSIGENYGVLSWANNATGTGIVGVGNGGSIATTIVGGSGVSGVGTSAGVVGFATTAPAASPSYSSGGYFSHGAGWAAVGGYLNDNPPGPTDNSTAFKVIGNGTVSTIVKGLNNEDLVMACPEAPEVLFQDYGIGTLVNGYKKIVIDPILTKNILVNEDHPLKVFIQLEGDCNGVYVTNKSAQSFEVKELQGGSSNVDFSWSIVATRAQEEIASFDGKSAAKVSDYSWRFRNAPPPLEITANASQQVVSKKIANSAEEMSLKKEHKKSKD